MLMGYIVHRTQPSLAFAKTCNLSVHGQQNWLSLANGTKTVSKANVASTLGQTIIPGRGELLHSVRVLAIQHHSW